MHNSFASYGLKESTELVLRQVGLFTPSDVYAEVDQFSFTRIKEQCGKAAARIEQEIRAAFFCA